ncbi:MAG: murein hydrolase activator EnvC family protein [Paracoccaceae bacterium]
MTPSTRPTARCAPIARALAWRVPVHRAPVLRATATAMLLALAACGGRQEPAPVVYRGSGPAGQGAAEAASGIVRTDSYEAVITRPGETVGEAAERVGLSPTAIAAYNGLTPDAVLGAGSEVILPPRPGGYGGVRVAEGQAVREGAVDTTRAPSREGALETAPLGAATAPVPQGEPGGEVAAPPAADGPRAGWSAARIAAALDDPQDQTSGAGAGAAASAEAGDERLAAADGGTGIAPPPSARRPLPPEPEAPETPASPGLGRYQTPDAPEVRPDPRTRATEREAAEAEAEATAALARAEPANEPVAGGASSRLDLGTRFQRPLEGPIAVPYNVSGSGTRNEGIDIAAAAGTPVRAAAAGEVALVSRSLGGRGTIVLIRHSGDVLTVYGRVDDVSVAKGATVSAGQTIGTVAAGDGSGEPRLHFEVRRGAESIDPNRVL